MTQSKSADYGISSKPLKFNLQHFTTKNMQVEDIDVNFLEKPIRCSTPTPSIDGTILVGHLDCSINASNTEEDSSTSTGEEMKTFLHSFVN